MFRGLYPILVSPAPLSRDEQVDALASGKRLRFERDPESDCRGPWDRVDVVTTFANGYWYGIIGFRILTYGSSVREGAAKNAVGLAESLGYRFASVID